MKTALTVSTGRLIGLAALCVAGITGSGGCRPADDLAAPPPAATAAAKSVKAAAGGSLLLTDAERAFLWECEHAANQLGKYGFAVLADALVKHQPQQLLDALDDRFRASVPELPAEPQWHRDEISGWRSAGNSPSDRTLSRAEFGQWLLAVSERFAPAQQSAGFELLAFTPLAREDLRGTWQGRCNVRLRGTDAEGRPREVVIGWQFQCRAPHDGAFTAGWLLNGDVTDVELRQSPQFLMQEVAAERGLLDQELFDNWQVEQARRLVTAGGVYLCDYNQDGLTDVLITIEQVEHNPRLYQGLPAGKFQDVTHRVGLPNVPGATVAAFADIDNDGWEDLIFPGQGVFRNRRGKIFQNVTLHTNLSQLIVDQKTLGVSGAVAADYDRDGLIDLYVTRADTHEHKGGSWIDGKAGNTRGNQLLKNAGNGQFLDVTEATETAGGRRSTFTAGWLDANDDGWPDLYVINEFGPGALLVNAGNGKFRELQLAAASQDFGSMGLATGDADNDGQIDIYVSNMYSKAGNRVMDNLPPRAFDTETRAKLRRMVAGSELHINQGGLNFRSLGQPAGVANVGWSWGAALVDLNNDGWLDIHATAGFMSHDRAKPDG